MPDLILMDIRLQGELDGVAVAQALRSRWNVPVVFVAADSDESGFERAKTAEPYGYILRPFSDRQLQITIEMALNKHRIEMNTRRLLANLREHLARVTKLRGLLPICANCKSIRNDKGQWESVEEYIRRRSDADFTHGICPDCAKKLYPEYRSRFLGKSAKSSGDGH